MVSLIALLNGQVVILSYKNAQGLFAVAMFRPDMRDLGHVFHGKCHSARIKQHTGAPNKFQSENVFRILMSQFNSTNICSERSKFSVTWKHRLRRVSRGNNFLVWIESKLEG